MEKTARSGSPDPVQEKLRQNKALWNKEVSSFINDLIHLKKMMNGWPSKFFKERSRITQPIPADPSTIIGALAGDFNDLVNKGNAIIQEQVNYSKNRRQKQPKQLNLPLQQTPATPAATPAPEAPKPDLSKQLSLGLNALEQKYDYNLIADGSNPFSRFLTRLVTPTFGFGEAARIRRLRMSLLTACVKTYKDLKRLHNEIVKSSKSSVVNSHTLMNSVWNHWSIVMRTFNALKNIKMPPISDAGGELEVPPEIQEERQAEEQKNLKQEQAVPVPPPNEMPLYKVDKAKNIMADYMSFGRLFDSTDTRADLQALDSLVDKIRATPSANRIGLIQNSNIEQVYAQTIAALNTKLNTTGSSLREIAGQLTKKKVQAPANPAANLPKNAALEEILVQAQLKRWLGKTRHQLLPGSSSASRLEVYRLIIQLKGDLDNVMNLLEKGFDQEQLAAAVTLVNREIVALRAMVRSLYYFEKPNEIPPTSMLF